MSIYFYGYFLIFISLFSSLYKSKNRNFFFIFTIGFLTILSGFRFYIGVDYEGYIGIINEIILGQSVHTELGFNSFVKLLTYLGGSEQLIILIFSFLTIYFVFIFIKYFSSNTMYSLFLFFTIPVFYLASFNQIRQFIAISLFLYSLRFIVEKKLIPYILILLLATLIHKTAILMLPMYFILTKKPSLITYSLLLIIYFITLQFIEYIFTIIGVSGIYLMNISDENTVKPLSFVLAFLFGMIYFFTKSFRSKDLFLNMLYIAVLISLTPLFSTLPSSDIVRLSAYFTFSLIILIPNYLLIIKNHYLKIIYFLLTIVISSIYFFVTIIMNGERYRLVPYKINFNIIDWSQII